ncbi:hypothetical protein ABIA32_000863 [Streptacidiphilus sp. MAP12-20]|uniref:hypothetical protein n=1 Tax=Streptacidiphilus sp. MAP12-20 TaxID=3156299 RepID=UPI003516B909
MGGAHPLPGAESDNRRVHRDGGYPADWPNSVVNAEADADHIELHQPVTVRRWVVKARELLAEHAGT